VLIVGSVGGDCDERKVDGDVEGNGGESEGDGVRFRGVKELNREDRL
jgi:hypothetical protein